MNVSLVVLNSKTNHRRIRLRKTALLGRGKASSLQIESSKVSRRHCEIVLGDDQVEARDLGSSNGTYLNGERLTPGELYRVQPGDELALGSVRFRVEYEPALAGGEAAAHPPAATGPAADGSDRSDGLVSAIAGTIAGAAAAGTAALVGDEPDSETESAAEAEANQATVIGDISADDLTFDLEGALSDEDDVVAEPDDFLDLEASLDDPDDENFFEADDAGALGDSGSSDEAADSRIALADDDSDILADAGAAEADASPEATAEAAGAIASEPDGPASEPASGLNMTVDLGESMQIPTIPPPASEEDDADSAAGESTPLGLVGEDLPETAERDLSADGGVLATQEMDFSDFLDADDAEESNDLGSAANAAALAGAASLSAAAAAEAGLGDALAGGDDVVSEDPGAEGGEGGAVETLTDDDFSEEDFAEAFGDDGDDLFGDGDSAADGDASEPTIAVSEELHADDLIDEADVREPSDDLSEQEAEAIVADIGPIDLESNGPMDAAEAGSDAENDGVDFADPIEIADAVEVSDAIEVAEDEDSGELVLADAIVVDDDSGEEIVIDAELDEDDEVSEDGDDEDFFVVSSDDETSAVAEDDDDSGLDDSALMDFLSDG